MNNKNTGFIKAYVLITYFIIVGILAVYAFSPFSGEVGFIFTRLIPHLVYIPLVLTALWYPRQILAHFLIFLLIIVFFVAGYVTEGWSQDLVFTIFTSFIYLWVYFAILLVPSWDSGKEMTTINREISPDRKMISAGISGVLKKKSFSDYSKSTTDEVCTESPFSVQVPEYRQVPVEQIEPLIESFRIRDNNVLSNTFRAIEAVGSPAEPYLINALKSPYLSVRENSARMLGVMESTDSICSLIEAMDDSSKRVHNAGIQALAKIGEPAIAPLLEALSDGRVNIRAGSCAALRIIGVKGAISCITPLLSDESHYVRKEAAKSLGRLGDFTVVGDLCLALNDESRGVRLAAVTALGRISDPESVDFLFSLLKAEKDCQVRERIIRALGLIGGESAIAAIKYATLDSDPEIRVLAKEYLFGLNCPVE